MDDAVADDPRRRHASRARSTGASRFPRHWVYDDSGRLSHKSGLADFKDWYRKSFGRHTPWGDADSEALVTAVETALERGSPAQVMQGAAKPTIRQGEGGDALVNQGDAGSEVFLVLDGVLRVEDDGAAARRVRAGGDARRARASARAAGGPRRCVAVTPCRVAACRGSGSWSAQRCSELSKGHRRDANPSAG